MIQARVQNMRSGWRTMFGVFSAASKVSTRKLLFYALSCQLIFLSEKVASSAFELVTRLNEEHFAAIVRHGSFADLTACITEFCKASKYQKISLLAIAMLRGIIPVMLECPDCGFRDPSTSTETATSGGLAEDIMIKFWFPLLFGFYDIIMNGEDLEVRRLYVSFLF
jgi:brefeldin A-inhibited guanine nucleotide-exchange protein